MTIEIKQLVVRAVVEPRRETAPAAVPGAGSAAGPAPRRSPPPASAPHAGIGREAVIDECVRQVLRRMRKGRER